MSPLDALAPCPLPLAPCPLPLAPKENDVTRMRPIRETITLEAAREIIDRAITPVDRTEHIRIDLASGRVVARPVAA